MGLLLDRVLSRLCSWRGRGMDGPFPGLLCLLCLLCLYARALTGFFSGCTPELQRIASLTLSTVTIQLEGGI